MDIFAGNILYGLAKVLDLILTGYTYILIARALVSWVSPDPYNPIVRFLHQVTEPVLGPLRRRLPVVFGGIDFSPIAVILAAQFLRYALVSSLLELASRMRMQ